MRFEKKYLNRPLMAQLEITDKCNHFCSHCYNLDSKKENRKKKIVADETIINIGKKLVENDIFAVVITGGEPLLKKKLTKSLISLFHNSDIKIGLNTNLILLDDDFVEFLKKYQIHILTSCPSANDVLYNKIVGVNSYDIFESKLKMLISAEIPCTVNMVVSKQNISEIWSTAQRLYELGCKSFSATPMYLNMEYPRFDLLLDESEIKYVIEELLHIETKLGLKIDILEALPKCVFPEALLSSNHIFLGRKCQAGRTVIGIACDGSVSPCSTNSDAYGNILHEDLTKIWERMNAWRSLQYIPEKCKKCSWIDKCNGGCRTNAKTMHGSWDSNEIWSSRILTKCPPTQDVVSHMKIAPSTTFNVNTNYKYRLEDPNTKTYVLYNQDDDSFFMINKPYFDFIKYLWKYNQISLTTISADYKVDISSDKLLNIIRLCIQKNILTINN